MEPCLVRLYEGFIRTCKRISEICSRFSEETFRGLRVSIPGVAYLTREVHLPTAKAYLRTPPKTRSHAGAKRGQQGEIRWGPLSQWVLALPPRPRNSTLPYP